MKSNGFEELKDKIDNLDGISEERKDILRHLVNANQKYMQDWIEEAQKEITSQRQLKKYMPEVCVAFVPANVVERLKREFELNPILNENPDKIKKGWEKQNIENKKSKGQVLIGHFFFTCTYKDFLQYIDPKKMYEACVTDINNKKAKVEYFLKFDRSMIQEEEKLYMCKKAYELEGPVIFSPYARRYVAAYVNADEIRQKELDDIIDVDLQLEKNNLDNVVKEDCQLLWNVEMISKVNDRPVLESEGKETKEYQTMAGGQIHKRYDISGVEENEYILTNRMITLGNLRIKDIPFEIKRIENEGKKGVRFDYMYPQDEFELWGIKINSLPMDQFDQFKEMVEKAGGEYFCDHYDKAGELHTNIRTMGQAWYELNKFGQDMGIFIEDIRTSRPNDEMNYTEVISYPKDYRAEGFFGKCAYTLYVCYKNEDHTNFVDDYINYVLMNMQKMYPQIAWKGLYH